MRWLIGSFCLTAIFITIFASTDALAQTPGDTVGWTQYDYQASYPTGQRITVDNLGRVHLVWISSYTYPANRRVRYVYSDSLGAFHGYDLGLAGGPQLAVNSQNQAGIIFSANTGLEYWTIDSQSHVATGANWPSLSIDHQDRIHILYYTPGFIITYTRSDDNGLTWNPAQIVDSTDMPSYMITSSPVSNKTAVIFYHFDSSLQLWTINYIQSLDGQQWDWQNGRQQVVPLYGDLNPYGADFDAVYDYNDDFHIIWNAQRGTPYDPPDTLYFCHFDAIRNQTSIISKWDPLPDPLILGAWNNVICKMSIAAQIISSLLVVTYTRFNSNDVSLAGFANGEIYLQYSYNGQNWSIPANITNSPSPDCAAGDCNSDHWSSLAEKIDNNLHLFYVNDKDAGAIPQSEGSITTNPLLFLRYPVSQLGITEDEPAAPSEFSLSQNYPNPFNARTTISYTLGKESDVKLEIYDLLGRRLETLQDDCVAAGSHSIIWNAADRASGVYYYRLKIDEKSLAKRCLLMK